MTSTRAVKKIGWAAVAVIIAASAFFDYRVLNEAYGSGPPYYGRTVNMDKWESPLPALLIIQVIAFAAAILIFLAERREPGRRR
jgi:hypothetical protein